MSAQSTNHLINYILHLADNALILGHRNSEWCGHGPVLELDIAITNISLDLIGQARNFYQYAAQLKNDGSTEDSLAYLRNADEFKNCLLVEQPNGDWAQTILRQFLFSNYQYLVYEKLQESKDDQIAAIAAKALKEVTYHLRWSSEWVIRLGDGTDESRTRMLNAIDHLYGFTEELLTPSAYEKVVSTKGTGVHIESIRENWSKKTQEIFKEATLPVPTDETYKKNEDAYGKSGHHTSHLIKILSEMQYLQKTYPGVNW
jgi:ring-1,2-phenylacetyl-CoA epoxidase subunit PaaC